ncbi:MAG TPA: MerR family transcriptional regulator [Desulfobacterales bacterium]|nr:MerR family transcriptional regulator [Desulfobacterales bacterium]
MQEGLTIGRLARQSGVGVETIRFYERQGLLPPPARTPANYRIYPEQDVRRLRFIRRAKALGFTLREIRELLDLRHRPDASKKEVRQRAEAKIADLDRRIEELARIRAALQHLVSACDGHGPATDCPILDALEHDESRSA